MKKGLILLFILFAYPVLSLTITAIYPSSGETLLSDDATIKCKISKEYAEEIANLSLHHDIDGTMELKQTATVTEIENDEDYSFDNIKNIPSGKYSWYCSASNSLGEYFQTSKRAFITPSTNQAPEITSYLPSDLDAELILATMFFSVEATDPDEDLLKVQWYVDGVIKEGGEELWNFNYTFEDLENHKVKVKVTDGSLFMNMEWNLSVKSEEIQQKNESMENISLTVDEELLQTEQNTTEALCGNSKIDFGETCETCPEDAACPSEYECKEGKCILEKKSNNTFLIVIVTLAFLGFAVIFLIVYRHIREKKLLPSDKELMQKTTITKKPVEKTQPIKKPKTKTSPKDFPGVTQKPQVKKKLPKKGDPKLVKYISESLKKGKDYDFINKNLLKAGWTEKQINEAISNFENEGFNKLSGNKKNSP